MLYIKTVRSPDGILLAASVCAGYDRNAETRNDWHTFDKAAEVADVLGTEYIATDAGNGVSPRYDVIQLPKIGDKVSKAFNGDSYPAGVIKSISKSLKLIVKDEGDKFYRVRETGSWRNQGTWSLTPGHVYTQNPSF
jgi:hypothetical protein